LFKERGLNPERCQKMADTFAEFIPMYEYSLKVLDKALQDEDNA
jgi:hypothetical protein